MQLGREGEDNLKLILNLTKIDYNQFDILCRGKVENK